MDKPEHFDKSKVFVLEANQIIKKEGIIMGYGCDTATAVSTTTKLNTILNATDPNGHALTFVGRYLNRVQGYQDELTSSEVTRLSNAGLYIFSI